MLRITQLIGAMRVFPIAHLLRLKHFDCAKTSCKGTVLAQFVSCQRPTNLQRTWIEVESKPRGTHLSEHLKQAKTRGKGAFSFLCGCAAWTGLASRQRKRKLEESVDFLSS